MPRGIATALGRRDRQVPRYGVERPSLETVLCDGGRRAKAREGGRGLGRPCPRKILSEARERR
jgi:hypothetical protein